LVLLNTSYLAFDSWKIPITLRTLSLFFGFLSVVLGGIIARDVRRLTGNKKPIILLIEKYSKKLVRVIRWFPLAWLMIIGLTIIISEKIGYVTTSPILWIQIIVLQFFVLILSIEGARSYLCMKNVSILARTFKKIATSIVVVFLILILIGTLYQTSQVKRAVRLTRELCRGKNVNQLKMIDSKAIEFFQANKALFQFGLIRALKDQDDQIRIEAINLLGKIKSKEALRSLLVLLNDENPKIKEAAQKSIEKIKGK
jgi:hypothetical protein